MNHNKQLEMMAREHDMFGVDEEVVKEIAEAAAEGAKTGYEKIEDAVVGGYKKIEDAVVTGYKKIEDGVVEGFHKVSDKFVEVLFTKEGERMEDAKARLRGEENEQ